MKQSSLGHYTATSEGIRSLEWAFYIGGDKVDSTLPGHDGWNRDQELLIECTVDADLASIHNQTHTDDRTKLAWVIVARSDTPKILASSPMEVNCGPQRISLTVSGRDVGGRVSTELTLGVVAGVPHSADRFAPHLPGHRVFTHGSRLQLEGSGSQLPILPVSFKEHGIIPSAHGLWWLRVNHLELDAPASSALWLWLNTDNPQIAALLENFTESHHDLLATFMAVDFSRQLLNLALAVDDLDFDEDYPDHSLGLTLVGVVRLVGDNLAQVRLAYQTDPGAVEAHLQAVVAAAAEPAL